MMRIAELETRTGVSRHTLRYYEKEGLLLEVTRAGNNYRDYPEAAVARVALLCQLKALGFSLREIREITDALRSNKMDCDQGAQLMAQKRVLIEQRIQSLKKVSKLLLAEQRRLEKSWVQQCEKEGR